RWLGLALGAVGAVSGGLNVVNYWPATTRWNATFVDWSMQTFEATWVLLVMTLGGALVVANLCAPTVRDAFAARARGTTWASNDRVVGALRAAIIGAFAAVPMLLVYAWLQPIVPATQSTAVALAAVLALGGVLAVRGKLVGALLLVVGG